MSNADFQNKLTVLLVLITVSIVCVWIVLLFLVGLVLKTLNRQAKFHDFFTDYTRSYVHCQKPPAHELTGLDLNETGAKTAVDPAVAVTGASSSESTSVTETNELLQFTNKSTSSTLKYETSSQSSPLLVRKVARIEDRTKLIRKSMSCPHDSDNSNLVANSIVKLDKPPVAIQEENEEMTRSTAAISERIGGSFKEINVSYGFSNSQGLQHEKYIH